MLNFTNQKWLIGMLHLPALPGTPHGQLTIDEIVSFVLRDAQTLVDAGFNALLVENMHDTPYLRRNVGPEIVAAVTVVCAAVKKQFPTVPLGVQILAGANCEALAVALACGADFIRAEGFVFAHIGDEGLFNSDAGKLLRYRKQIGAEHIAVLTDIKKKHSSHAITADISLAEACEAAQFFHTDGIIITGTATGKAADIEQVRAARAAVPSLPLIIGSGITAENIADYRDIADGFIIGTALKVGGDTRNPVSPDAANRIVNAVVSG